MKKLLFIFLISLTLMYSNEDSKNWTYKDWSINDLSEQGFLKATTHGTTVRGHEFGIIKPKNKCDTDILWLSFSTYEKNIEDLKAKTLTFEVLVNNEKFKLDLNVVNTFKMTPNMSIALFTNYQMNENFIKLLKKGNNIKFNIIKPNNLVEKFDIPTETFSLNGFIANYTKMVESCKDINQLLIPASKIKLKPEIVKKYEIQNLITDHSQCNNSNINQYVKNESRYGDEFTISNNYLFFSYGNDGQDEYEDINVINICDPLNPKLVTKISDTASQMFSIYSDNSYLYVDSYHSKQDKNENTFKIIDLSNYKLISKIKQSAIINPFVVDGSKLFLTQSSKVKVYDLKNKLNPILLKEFKVPQEQYSVNGIDIDDKYIYITGKSNLLIYDKKTFELLIDRKFDFRTSSIVVNSEKAILALWSNEKGEFIYLLDLHDLENIVIERKAKVKSKYLRRLNPKQIVYGKYSPNVNVLDFTDINLLYEKIKNFEN